MRRGEERSGEERRGVERRGVARRGEGNRKTEIQAETAKSLNKSA